MRYDVVVLGAGLDGLVAAAYLARAGRSVLVVEEAEELGGVAGNLEIAPGYQCGAVYDDAALLSRRVVDELDLAEHGLRWADAADAALVVLHGAGALPLTPAGVAAAAPADAAAYGELAAFLDRAWERLLPLLEAPLRDPDEVGPGDVLGLLWLAGRLRGLGRHDFEELARFLPMPVRDVVDERFASVPLRAGLGAVAVSGSPLGPYGAGTAFGFLYHAGAGGAGRPGAPRFPRGGSAAVAAAVAATARAAGAEIRTATPVRAIAAAGGRVRGVAAGDDEIGAVAVVSSLDPVTTLLGLVGARHLPPEFVARARSVRSRGTRATVAFALDGLPRPAAGEDAAPAWSRGRMWIGSTLDDIERAADAAGQGRLPERPVLELTLPSVADPGLAPAGKHVAVARVPYVAHADLRRAAVGADELRRRVADALESRFPGFADRVVEVRTWMPEDLEAVCGHPRGCPYHVDMTLDQLLHLRPVPGWAGHRTPIEGLWLAGPGCHPGGGLTGLPGRNAATRLLGR